MKFRSNISEKRNQHFFQHQTVHFLPVYCIQLSQLLMDFRSLKDYMDTDTMLTQLRITHSY